jgi:hypothetical protein
VELAFERADPPPQALVLGQEVGDRCLERPDGLIALDGIMGQKEAEGVEHETESAALLDVWGRAACPWSHLPLKLVPHDQT